MRTTTALLALLLLHAPLRAQYEPYHSGDFQSLQDWVLLDAATGIGNYVQLNPVTGGRGALWHTNPIPVAYGFQARIRFRITLGNSGGDGMAFVIQNAAAGTSAIGSWGGGMGYQGIENSLAIELDTYIFPTADTGIHVNTNGTAPNSAGSELAGATTARYDDGQIHVMDVIYIPGLLKIFLDDARSPTLEIPYSFESGGTLANGSSVGGLSLINGTRAYIGFTAATGAAVESHDVLSLTITPLDHQHNTPRASLTFNGHDRPERPISVSIDPMSEFFTTMRARGAASAPVAVFLGAGTTTGQVPTNAGFVDLALTSAPVTIYDGFGTTPGAPVISTDSSGVFSATVPTIASPTGLFLGALQGLIGDPSSPAGVTLTAVSELSFAAGPRRWFVSGAGSNSSTGSVQAPFATVSHAMAQAAVGDVILLAAGTYSEQVLSLKNGVSILGGRDPSDFAAGAGTSTINTGFRGVTGNGITSSTTIENVAFVAGSAPGQGAASMGVRLANCGPALVFKACSFTAGNGASANDAADGLPGVDGCNGQHHAGSAVLVGAYGGPGAHGFGFGTPNCPNPWSTAAGLSGPYHGGNGAGTNTDPESIDYFGTIVPGGSGGSWADCFQHPGNGGTGGAGIDGSDGAPGQFSTSHGTFVLNGNGVVVWSASSGGAGQNGANGSGGGGGGRSGGVNCAFGSHEPRAGGGGGGGGNGGAGGGAGACGGASCALILIDASPTLDACSFTTGSGGNGGNGGAGGLGGTGGGGGTGASNSGTTLALSNWTCHGGTGGQGGNGGNGGCGAGGNGGMSYGIFKLGSSAPVVSGATYSIGNAGLPGLGGLAPGLTAGADGLPGVTGPSN